MDDLRLSPEQLRRRCDPDALGFETTAEVEPLTETLGQPRALSALDFGLEMDAPGYHVFATGAIGTGRRSTLEALLRERAAGREEPGDWVYLFDFAAPEKPRAVSLPAGRGEELAREMAHLIEEARRRISDAFESRNYQERRSALADSLEELLFALAMLGDDRAVAATYAAGREVHRLE